MLVTETANWQLTENFTEIHIRTQSGTGCRAVLYLDNRFDWLLT